MSARVGIRNSGPDPLSLKLKPIAYPPPLKRSSKADDKGVVESVEEGGPAAEPFPQATSPTRRRALCPSNATESSQSARWCDTRSSMQAMIFEWNRFRDCIHKREVSGDFARHAYDEPPRTDNPMSTSQAEKFIRQLADKWLHDMRKSIKRLPKQSFFGYALRCRELRCL